MRLIILVLCFTILNSCKPFKKIPKDLPSIAKNQNFK
jgi:hypothetical protein